MTEIKENYGDAYFEYESDNVFFSFNYDAGVSLAFTSVDGEAKLCFPLSDKEKKAISNGNGFFKLNSLANEKFGREMNDHWIIVSSDESIGIVSNDEKETYTSFTA